VLEGIVSTQPCSSETEAGIRAAGQAVARKAAMERHARAVQRLRRALLVPTNAREQRNQIGPIIKRAMTRCSGGGAQHGGEVRRADPHALTGDECDFEHIAQFTHIAGPVMCFQEMQRGIIKPRRGVAGAGEFA